MGVELIGKILIEWVHNVYLFIFFLSTHMTCKLENRIRAKCSRERDQKGCFARVVVIPTSWDQM